MNSVLRRAVPPDFAVLLPPRHCVDSSVIIKLNPYQKRLATTCRFHILGSPETVVEAPPIRALSRNFAVLSLRHRSGSACCYEVLYALILLREECLGDIRRATARLAPPDHPALILLG